MKRITITDDQMDTLESYVAEANRYYAQLDDAKNWGGPTIQPRPVDPALAFKALRELERIIHSSTNRS